MFFNTDLLTTKSDPSYSLDENKKEIAFILSSDGEHKTAHYALCTGFMAFGMMLPGMFSGVLQEAIGYQSFFIWVMVATIPGLVLIKFLNINPGYGIKKETE